MTTKISLSSYKPTHVFIQFPGGYELLLKNDKWLAWGGGGESLEFDEKNQTIPLIVKTHIEEDDYEDWTEKCYNDETDKPICLKVINSTFKLFDIGIIVEGMNRMFKEEGNNYQVYPFNYTVIQEGIETYLIVRLECPW